MRAARATLIAIFLVGAAAAAAAGDMTLTRTGELYRIAPSDEGLVLVHRLADGTVVESLIPQTAGIAAASVQVGVDEPTGAVFVMWQIGDGLEALIEFAWLIDEAWSGPFVVAGGDGTAARNPQLMLDRFETVIDEGGEPVEFGATFLHMVWWGYVEDEDDGSGFLASVTLDDNGHPNFDSFSPVALQDLLPYGIGCPGISDATGLAHPKLFTDPQAGVPHVFASDFQNCVFQILSINYDVIEEWVGDVKRRRAITVWRSESMIAINPDMALASAKVEVGHGLDVLLYWDIGNAIAYVQMDENGVPPIQALEYGDLITRDQAKDMVQNLVR